MSFAERFTAYISQFQNESLVNVLRDISNNYPLFMRKILETEPTEEATANLSMLTSMRRDEVTLSSINGRHTPIKHLDVHQLMDIFNTERTVRDILRGEFHFNSTMLDDVFGAIVDSENNFLLDTRSPYVKHINDIEKDGRYETWSPSLTPLKGQLFGLPRVRRNIVEFVAFVDPTTVSGVSQLLMMNRLIEYDYPVRCGMVPVWNLGNRVSRKAAFAFHHLYSKVNRTTAFQFLFDSLFIGGIDPVLRRFKKPSEANFRAAYEYSVVGIKDVLPWTELHTLYSDSDERRDIEATLKYARSTGVSRGACVMNGRLLNPMTMDRAIFYEAQQAITNIGRIVTRLHMSDRAPFDPFDLLQYSKMMLTPSLDPRILSDQPLSLGITNLPFERQLEYIHFIGKLKWDVTMPNATNSVFLFCKKDFDTKPFIDFAHECTTKANFAINPEVPTSLRAVFPIDPDSPVLVVNGRVYKNVDVNSKAFLKLALIWGDHNANRPLDYVINSITYNREGAISYLQCLITDWIADKVQRRLYSDDFWRNKNPLIYSKQEPTSDVTWDLAIDPTSRDFQRISSIIDYCERHNLANIRIAIILPWDLSKSLTTVTTYYRNALETDNALFTMLNDTTTYSAMPDMPLSWVTESMRMSTDFDNILLKQLAPATHEGVYVLTNILVEGDCYTTDGKTAEGTELAIVNEKGEKVADTIVMMNGYFQLTANPGAWSIALGGARTNSIYTMEKTPITVYSFSAKHELLYVRHRPGMEGMKVYNVSYADQSNTTRVDVFSVASGHLYERLMKIMMLSVRRNSKYNVKFWIVKNFLSPTFKATLPIMAHRYNFSYQLVSYKWPTWVREQYEKQRIIWGNKILFLDVIFPIDLDRVIYIDSDQIVRTDLNELMRMDFEGAPYAFTPMCGSRAETEPFRFWKQGYWLNHLKGLPYHISALFAIDLRRFRQMAAGDQLRFYYNQLSADPASLSNLDQDLPNYAQHWIPIYSLPQEWLWCETWCSDETMDKARTIDLCNNPLTHAGKLDIAQTRIKEWPGLDEEARNISAGPDDYQKFFFK